MLGARLGNLIVPQHIMEDQHPSASFMKRLQEAFGWDMHCEWNPMKKRWVIEVCYQHHGGNQKNADGFVPHSHLCSRYYAWLVRDEETNEYMPLCDRVIEKLKEKETYRKYGTGEAALERFRAESKAFDDERESKQREAAREILRQNSKDNKAQWAKFRTLFQRHDMRPNK